MLEDVEEEGTWSTEPPETILGAAGECMTESRAVEVAPDLGLTPVLEEVSVDNLIVSSLPADMAS